MGLWDKIKGQLIDIIEWLDNIYQLTRSEEHHV